MKRLTPKQQAFCNYYVETSNASEAYRRAYNASKTKPEVVAVKACELLKSGNVAVMIDRIRETLQKNSDIDKGEAIKELTNIIRSNPLDYVEIKEAAKKENEKFSRQIIVVKDLLKLSPEQQRCIKSIQPVKGGGIKIEFESKISAIDRLSKMLGWEAPTKLEATGKDGAELSPVINIQVNRPDIDLRNSEDDIDD